MLDLGSSFLRISRLLLRLIGVKNVVSWIAERSAFRSVGSYCDGATSCAVLNKVSFRLNSALILPERCLLANLIGWVACWFTLRMSI